MVRRVGFGNTPEEPVIRKPRRTPKTRQPSKTNTTKHTDIQSMGVGARIFQFAFLLFWISGWTAGIMLALAFLFSGDGFSTPFLIFWLIFAVFFWFAAAKRILALLRGK